MNEPIDVRFETRVDDLALAAEAVDRKSGGASRKNLHSVAIVIVAWMFLPDAFGQGGEQGMLNPVLSWVMLLLCAGLLWMIWYGPDKANRRFAQSKVEHVPQMRLVLGETSAEVWEGDVSYALDYEHKKTIAVEYGPVLAVRYGDNRVFAVPRDQLDEEQWTQVTEHLRTALGGRFEVMPLPEKKNRK